MVLMKKPRVSALLGSSWNRGAFSGWGSASNRALRAATGQLGMPGGAAEMVIVTPFRKGSVLEAGRVMVACVGLEALGRSWMALRRRFTASYPPRGRPFVVNSPQRRSAE